MSGVATPRCAAAPPWECCLCGYHQKPNAATLVAVRLRFGDAAFDYRQTPNGTTPLLAAAAPKILNPPLRV